ncbi:hypothetical protein V6N13_033456 [Hibiscus sabdariffa]
MKVRFEGACESEDDDVYSFKIRYLSDGEGDKELQSAKDNLKVVKDKDGPKIKKRREENGVESDNANFGKENEVESEIHREADNEGRDA